MHIRALPLVLPLLAVAVLPLPGLAQGQATVNDPVSPGTLADGKLSLDEAIRVVNGQLALSRLSAAERAQISGAGLPVVIEIDARVTPKIALAQDPTPLDGASASTGFTLRGVGGRPVLDAAGRAHALHLRSNAGIVAGLAIQGGSTGIVADASQHLRMGAMLRLMDLEIAGQSVAGLRLQAAGSGGTTPVMARMLKIASAPTGVVVDDRSSNGGFIMSRWEHIAFTGVGRAFDVSLASDGQTTMVRAHRVTVRESGQLIRERRTAASTQRAMLMFIGGDFRTTGDTADIQGNAVSETAFHFHHCVFEPAAGMKAMRLWPQNARFDWHGSENVVRGDVEVVGNRLNRRLWAWNNHFRDGMITFANDGTQPSLRWNRFQRCTIRALPANGSRVPITTSELDTCVVDGQSLFGDIVLENSYLRATSLQGSASSQSPAPSPWIGTAAASTGTPPIGGHVDLSLSMPPGMAGVWFLGFADADLSLTEEPWRFYADRTRLFHVPAVMTLFSTIRLPVPDDLSMVGVELYGMPVAFPFQGQTHTPPFHLPAGVYLDITR